MRIASGVLALLCVLPAALHAQSTSATGKSGDGEKDRVICRRETPIGSLIATRKMCLTKRQWRDREVAGQEAAEQIVEANRARNPSGP